jgi:hypothetical protein
MPVIARYTLALMMAKSELRLTGEPCDTETVTHGSEGGGWKSAASR